MALQAEVDHEHSATDSAWYAAGRQEGLPDLVAGTRRKSWFVVQCTLSEVDGPICAGLAVVFDELFRNRVALWQNIDVLEV